MVSKTERSIEDEPVDNYRWNGAVSETACELFLCIKLSISCITVTVRLLPVGHSCTTCRTTAITSVWRTSTVNCTSAPKPRDWCTTIRRQQPVSSHSMNIIGLLGSEVLCWVEYLCLRKHYAILADFWPSPLVTPTSQKGIINHIVTSRIVTLPQTPLHPRSVTSFMHDPKTSIRLPQDLPLVEQRFFLEVHLPKKLPSGRTTMTLAHQYPRDGSLRISAPVSTPIQLISDTILLQV